MARRSSLKTSDHYVPRRRNSIGPTTEIQVTLRDNTQVKRRTSITFQENDDVKEVEPVSSMVRRKEDLWVTKGERQQTKQELKYLTLLAREKPEALAKSSVCVRGIEHRLSDDASKNIFASRSSILHLQEIQKVIGVYDDDALRVVYKSMSGKSAMIAQKRAEEDYAHVRKSHRALQRMARRGSM